jgi:hypothetical protein
MPVRIKQAGKERETARERDALNLIFNRMLKYAKR